MPLPVFGTGGRGNNNNGNSFLGTRYFQKYPAPGRYETGRTTLNTLPLSRSRTSDWTRRYRNTRSMEGTQAMLSLGGADRVGEKVGPAPGTYEAPPDSFAKAMSRRNTWTAAFAGRTSRLPPPRDALGTHVPRYGVREKRSARRTLPPRKKKWTDTRPVTAAPAPTYQPSVASSSSPTAADLLGEKGWMAEIRRQHGESRSGTMREATSCVSMVCRPERARETKIDS